MNDSTHNFAGLTLDERARLELDASLETARGRWETISKAIADAPGDISTETQAESFTTVVAQIQSLLKKIDQAHDDVKDPYLSAGRVVDAQTNVFRDTVDEAKRRLEGALTRYQLRKQDDIDRKRAEERQREAEDPEPSFVPHVETDRKRSRIRSVEGAVAHLQDTLTIEIDDVTKIPLRYLNRPKVRQALISEMLPDARKGDEIEGITVQRGAKSRVKA